MGNTTFKCKYTHFNDAKCNSEFKTALKLAIHSRVHEEKKEEVCDDWNLFRCTYEDEFGKECGKEFKSSRVYQLHGKKHSEEPLCYIKK